MEIHQRWLDQSGISCIPSADLQVAAEAYGTAVWRTDARPNAGKTDRYGRPYLNALGQFGAQLFAEYFGLSCDWTVYDRVDQGWDVLVPASPRFLRVDVKTRQGLLVVPERQYDGTLRISGTADYLALVHHAEPRFILCGVIAVAQFRAQCFRVDFGYEPSWAVRTSALETLPMFRAQVHHA